MELHMLDRNRCRTLLVAGWIGACSAGALAATAPAAAPTQIDAKGGHDHPLVRRFDGSWMVGYKASEWEQATFPTGMTVKDSKWVDPLTVEGRVTKAIYVAPAGKSPLEVFRNYEQALVGAGFQRRFSCESQCAPLYFALRSGDSYTAGMTWANGSVVTPSGSRYSLDAGTTSSSQGRFWYGTLPRNGQTVHVLVYTAAASNDTTNQTATYLQIVEPKAMPTGQVKVDASAIEQGLKADGRMALYGLYFDTGKAEVKPESKEQLGEMARLLQAQPALRVYIVGHTDSQGTLESNMALSQQRAQAVVEALATGFKIDARRMAGRGVGNLAPLSTNTTDEGRARNRRVELVLQ